MLKCPAVLSSSKRYFALPFHRYNAAPKAARLRSVIFSSFVFPANLWAVWYYKRQEHKRIEREKQEGEKFHQIFPRYIKPLPWGDGETPFFAAMCKYWGFSEPKTTRFPRPAT